MTSAMDLDEFHLGKVPIRAIRRALLVACLVASCFPYVKTIYATDSDLQPLALLLGISFLLASLPSFLHFRFTRVTWLIGILLAVVALFAFIKLLFDTGFTFRSCAYYLSPLVFFTIGVACKKEDLFSDKFIFIVAIIWLSVGLVQKLYDPQFAFDLLRYPRTTENRGVIALAAEPSFYAIQCLMLLMLNELWRSTPKHGIGRHLNLSNLTSLILIFQILFLAQSFFGVILLLVFVAVYMLLKYPVFSFSIAVAVALLFVAPSSADLKALKTSERRVLSLTAKVLDDPLKLIMSDQSAGERLTDIVLSLKSVFAETIISPGSNTTVWRDFVRQNLGAVSYLKFAASGSRIMSGIGAGVFELGSIGLLFWACVLIPLIRRDRISQITALTLSVVLLAAIPLSLPLVGAILGVIASPCRTK